MNIPRVSSANAATLAAQYLMEALKHPTPNAPFETINDTHHTALINLAKRINIIPKGSDQQSTNSHNGQRFEVVKEPEQGRTQVTHRYPTR